jgi:serine/threonine-protein kinase
MDDRDRCRGCGKTRPADAPGGLCPACLLRAGLAGGDSAGDDLGLALGWQDERAASGSVDATLATTMAPGVLATLAETLAGIPRVLLRDTDPVTGAGPLVRPSSPEMPGSSDRFARLQLLGEVARGGMGAILKGRDTDLGRDLAVKILLEQHRENPDLIRRFIEEAQISGQLQHPGVVPVYELGTLADRRPYFAMKLVKGRTLTALLEERAGPADDQPRLLGIFEQVCLTMAYAHTRGVIHRDLKPSNIMVGSFGEVQVMDWGLAKVLAQGGAVDDATAGRIDHETVIQTARSGAGAGAGAGADAGASQAGSIMGTPAYMPPEQASGEVDRLDERADVFALGSILCEVLTGQPAFTGRTMGEIQRKAARGDLSDACGRLDACGADPDLVALARDCLACEREDRPRNAGAVTDRLTAYLSGVQERLRTAELARVEAQARAEEEAKQRVLADALAHEAQAHALEERRRRRLQVGLALAVLALTTIGGLGTTAYLHQRQAHAAQVDLALNEATLLRDQARAAADDLGRWQAAREAIRRVDVALGDGGGGDARARLRLDDLRREVEAGTAAARHDRALLAALADIRLAQLDLGAGATDTAYAEAFRRAGIDIDALPPAEAAARLRARPASVRLPLVGYLDAWTTVRRADEQPAMRWRRPLAVARAADGDPGRDRLRALVGRDDLKTQAAALQALAEDRQAAELPPASTLLLAFALKQADDLPRAVAVLERAAQRYPGDVWINYNLAEFLTNLPTPRRAEAVRYYTAARAQRPETAHDLGHLLDRMGRGEDAIATFRELVRVRPGDPRHLGCLGTTLLARDHRDEGLETLDRAIAAARASIRRQPDDSGHQNALGYALDARGDHEGAIAAYREALRIKPGYTVALFNLVDRLKAKGDQDGTLAVLRTAIWARPDHAPSHHALSQALQEKGDYDGALAAIQEAIRLSPDQPAYRSHLSNLLKAQGLDDAIVVTPASAGIKTDDYAAHVAQGEKLYGAKDLKGAAAEFRAAIRIKPENAYPRDWLGFVLIAQGDLDAAIVELNEAIRMEPEYAQAHRNLGRALQAKGNLDGAIAAYREARRYQPRDLSIRRQLVEALKARGYSSATRDVYREVFEVKADGLDGLLELGQKLLDGRVLDAADAVYHEALRLEPGNALAHAKLGNTLRLKHELDTALAECREAVRLAPDFAAVHYFLGWVLRDRGDLDGAIAEFRATLQLNPKDANFHAVLAQTLQAKNDLEGAIAEWRETIRLAPKRAPAYGSLGLALREKGDLNGAITAFRAQLRLNPGLASAVTNLVDTLTARKGRKAPLCAVATARNSLSPRVAYELDALMAPLMARVVPDERIALLDTLIREQPDQWASWLARGRCLLELGRTEEAAGDFARALALMPRLQSPLQVDDPSGVYTAAVADPEVFELLTWFRPDDHALLLQRVRHLARQRRWREAAAVMARYNDQHQQPLNILAWRHEAELWLFVGDRENYRRACRGMVERFGSTSDRTVAQQTLVICLLEPDALPDRRVLDHLLARFRDRPPGPIDAWSRLAEGLYEYRAGNPSAAIEWLDPFRAAKVSTEPERVQKALACVILALAHKQLGQADEARRQLALAEELARKAELSPERGDRLPGGWTNWLRYHGLRREAEGLLSAEAPARPTAGKVAPDPEDSKAPAAFLRDQFQAVSTLIGSDIDQAEKSLATLKDRVQALDPAAADSRTRVRRGQAAIRYFEGEIARVRAVRVGLEGRLEANPNDLDALSKYTLHTTREVFPLIASDPGAARNRLARAREFLEGLKSRAGDPAKARIDRSLRSLAMIEARIDAEKTRARLLGQKAPPLKLETWVNGSPLSDEDLKGKVVLLDFWAAWCGPCLATFPHLRQWNDRYAGKGLVIIGVTGYFNYSWDEKVGNITHSEGEVPPEKEQAMLVQFAAHHKLTHRFGLSRDFPFSKDYGVTGIPQAVVIDRDGIIRLIKVGSGEANAREIGDLLEKLLEPGPSAGG